MWRKSNANSSKILKSPTSCQQQPNLPTTQIQIKLASFVRILLFLGLCLMYSSCLIWRKVTSNSYRTMGARSRILSSASPSKYTSRWPLRAAWSQTSTVSRRATANLRIATRSTRVRYHLIYIIQGSWFPISGLSTWSTREKGCRWSPTSSWKLNIRRAQAICEMVKHSKQSRNSLARGQDLQFENSSKSFEWRKSFQARKIRIRSTGKGSSNKEFSLVGAWIRWMLNGKDFVITIQSSRPSTRHISSECLTRLHFRSFLQQSEIFLSLGFSRSKVKLVLETTFPSQISIQLPWNHKVVNFNRKAMAAASFQKLSYGAQI